MDFSAKDKASGIAFCSALFQRPRQGLTQILVNFAPPETQNQTNRPARGHAHLHVNITVEMRRL